MARQWTDEEICRTIALIKERRPALWEQYIVGEINNNRIDPDLGNELWNFVHAELFPEVDIRELTFLFLGLRMKTRDELKLEWPKGNLAGFRPCSK